jgi:hypothetical protein
MKSICPACGKKVSVFSRIGQPIVCRDCEMARREAPAEVRKTIEAESDLLTGRLITIGAIAFAIFVMVVPSREGASPSSKLSLIAMALVALGAGLKKVAEAKRKLSGKRK